MRVVRFETFQQMASLAAVWDRLAGGVPFRRWDWQALWWQTYRQQRVGRELFILVVLDDADQPVAIAPWFVDPCAWRGRMLRPLGVDEVCSDYLGLLCAKPSIQPATEALCDWLCQHGGGARRETWDVLELEGLDAEDVSAWHLIEGLRRRGLPIHQQAGPSCWRLKLPATWKDYLGRLSKSRRKQVRRIERRWLDNGRAVLHTAVDPESLRRGWEVLVQLHQKRRAALGQTGRFASPLFVAFHHDLSQRLCRAGQLLLHWIEVGGRPVAVEYQIAGGDCVYAYQAGIDPEAVELEPGTLITVATLRQAIQRGYRAFDFLRGDETYKSHFRAAPRPTMLVQIAANRWLPRLRLNSWQAWRSVRHSVGRLLGHQPLPPACCGCRPTAPDAAGDEADEPRPPTPAGSPLNVPLPWVDPLHFPHSLTNLP